MRKYLTYACRQHRTIPPILHMQSLQRSLQNFSNQLHKIMQHESGRHNSIKKLYQMFKDKHCLANTACCQTSQPPAFYSEWISCLLLVIKQAAYEKSLPSAKFYTQGFYSIPTRTVDLIAEDIGRFIEICVNICTLLWSSKDWRSHACFMSLIKLRIIQLANNWLLSLVNSRNSTSPKN